MPHLYSRLCILLSITTLVVAGLIEEDESAKVDETDHTCAYQWKKQKVTGKSRHDLVSSLQMLGNFIGLLAPPRSAVSAANRAAAKAVFFISGTSVESVYLDGISMNENSTEYFAWLKGYVVSYFASLCGAFVWGVDSSSWGSKRHRKILGTNMEFLASALKGPIKLGCDEITWRAYVLGFISLMVICMPTWILEVDVHVMKIISKKLSDWNERDLALELLGIRGHDFMGVAAEIIIESQP